MIEIKSLTKKNIGQWVVYRKTYGPDHHHPETKEYGRIKSWNARFIFVVYKCADQWRDFSEYTGCATNPEDLDFISLLELERLGISSPVSPD